MSRASIVDAAVAFVDEQGLAALTMRALGESMRVQAMAIYTWVPSREDLLDAIVERVVDELYTDPAADGAVGPAPAAQSAVDGLLP